LVKGGDRRIWVLEYMISSKDSHRTNCLVIPGIGISYFKGVQLIKTHPIFREFCRKADIDFLLPSYDQPLTDYTPTLKDTLENQIQSYVVNCAMVDIYGQRGIVADYVLGYSMGIYAALYAGGYYSFEAGLSVVKKAFELVSEACRHREQVYGMGLVLGLTEQEIHTLIFADTGNAVEIAVHNGKRAFVLAGEADKLEYCLALSLEIGAMGSKRILTDYPYHSSFLQTIQSGFMHYLEKIAFKSPVRHVLSPIDGQIIPRGPGRTADTITRALFTPLHFDTAVHLLASQYRISACYETGPNQSMRKLMHYINRKIIVYPFISEEAP